MLVYRYPGNQIEYLDSKAYDIQDVEGDDLSNAFSNGWSDSPDKAEKLAKKLSKSADVSEPEVYKVIDTVIEPAPINPAILP